jgi:GLPGLI family protein
MKKVKLLLAALFLVYMTTSVVAQKANLKDGFIVNYTLTLSGDGGEMAGMEMFMPKQMIMTVKGTKSKIELPIENIGNTTVLADNKNGSGVMLLDMMGQKMQMSLTSDQMKKMSAEGEEMAKKLKVKLSGNTKEIAGYKCEEAIVTGGEMTEQLSIYFTKDIPFVKSSYNASYAGLIDGCLMEFSSSVNQISMTMTASSVTSTKVGDDAFSIPAGYTEMSSEQMQQMLGGQ